MKTVFTLVVLSVGLVFAAQDPVQVTLGEIHAACQRMPQDHPRIRMTPETDPFLKIRNGTDTEPAHLHARDQILKAAADALGKDPVPFKRTGRRLSSDKVYADRILAFSAAWRLTGERKYVDACRQEMFTAIAWTNWVPDHYLGTAHMLQVTGTAYDWIHEALSDEDRATIFAGVCAKGLDQMGCNDWWRRTDNNWAQVCYDGVATAAIAFYEQMPDRAEKLLLECVTHVPKAIRPYAPEGEYPEGAGYWNYGTGRFVHMLDVFEKAFGTTFGLYEMPGFAQTGDYVMAMYGPSGHSFNYSDAGRSRRTFNPALLWLSVRANRPDWALEEREEYRDPNTKYGMYDFLLNPKFPLPLAEPRIPLDYFSNGRNPVAALRSSRDRNAAYVAIKGGRASYNHGHMDTGSFVYDADGVRWALDLGSQNYHSIEKLGTIKLFSMHQDSTRWTVFRLGNLSHNLVTVDDRRMQVKGFATPVSKGSGIVSLDLTEVVGRDLCSAANRTFTLDRATRVLKIEDVLEGVKGETARWAMTTDAKAVVDGNVVHLTKMKRTRKGDVPRRLDVVLDAPVGASWQVVDIAKGPNAWDCANDGCSQLVFKLPPDAQGAVRTTVRLVPVAVSK